MCSWLTYFQKIGGCKVKRLFALISFVIVFSLVLTACSGGTSEKIQGSGKGSKQLIAWAWNINVPVLEKAAKDFEKANPGFKLKVVEMGNDAVYSKLTTGLQAGGQGLPDIVLVEDDRAQGYLKSFPKKFVDLTKKGFDKHLDKFPGYKKELLTKDGSIYGFPFDAGPTGVFYRTDYFQQAGVDPNKIETWDDLIEAGKIIKQKVGVDLIGIDTNNDDGLYRMMLNQQGTFYFDKDNNIQFTSQQSKKAMEVNQKLKDAELVKNTVGWDAWVSALAEGKVAIAPSGAWLSGSLTKQSPETKGKWGVFLLPAFEKGGNRAANLGGGNFMIPSSSQNQDLAYKFMEFFATSNEAQEAAIKGGLFPSLNTVYNSTLFTAPDEFFGNQKIGELFAKEMNSIPTANYTGNYSVAKDEAKKAQSEIMNGKNIETTLKDAEKRLKNRLATKK